MKNLFHFTPAFDSKKSFPRSKSTDTSSNSSRSSSSSTMSSSPLYTEIKAAEDNLWDLAAESGGRGNMVDWLTHDCTMTFFDGTSYGPDTLPNLEQILESRDGAIKAWRTYYFSDIHVEGSEQEAKITYHVEVARKTKDKGFERVRGSAESTWKKVGRQWRLAEHHQSAQ